MCFAPQRRALFRPLNLQKWSEPLVFLTFWLRNVRATTACTFSTSELVRTPGAFNILTSKCASRHNGVHFFDIWTSKSGPNPWCFQHLHFEMCFAPQRRALFRHLNFQKRSDAEVFCTYWLRNVLRATTACNFSSLIWPAAGSAPAALASLLFDPPELQIIGKTQCVATFLPFRASASAFFWLFLFSDLLSSTSNLSLLSASACSAFHLSILSEVWLLNFLRLGLILRVSLLLVFLHVRCIPHQNSQRLFWASVWFMLDSSRWHEPFSSGNAFLSRMWMQRPDVWICTF